MLGQLSCSLKMGLVAIVCCYKTKTWSLSCSLLLAVLQAERNCSPKHPFILPAPSSNLCQCWKGHGLKCCQWHLVKVTVIALHLPIMPSTMQCLYISLKRQVCRSPRIIATNTPVKVPYSWMWPTDIMLLSIICSMFLIKLLFFFFTLCRSKTPSPLLQGFLQWEHCYGNSVCLFNLRHGGC